jgi:hypothetical protein
MSDRPTRPLLLRVGVSRLSAGFLLLPLLALPGRRVEGATPTRFTTVNRSPYVIRAVHACPSRSATWGDDLLAGRSIAPGQQLALEIQGGCGVYDLRFVADDGIEFLEDGVPFCAPTEDEAKALEGASGPPDRDDVVTLGADTLRKSERPRAAKESR